MGFTLIAATLRFRAFGRLGLTHFDEGIYALAGLWSVRPRGLVGLDPQVIAYSPPGFPALIGVSYLLFGVADSSALLVSTVFGVLTVPVVAWVSRRTFGPGAGCATAAFATFSTAHIAFSRKALTDVPFLVFWLLALGLGGRFLEKPRVARAIALGVAIGIAQNFKYNGYLTGAIVGLAALRGIFTRRGDRWRNSFVATFGLGLVALLIGAVLYWPWYAFVESQGGYAALIRHHRRYLSGPDFWLPNWKIQLAQVVALSGGPAWGALAWGGAGLGLALASTGFRRGSDDPRWTRTRKVLGLMVGGFVFVAIPDLGWWAGLAWSIWLLVDSRPARRVLGACWLVLSVITPFYHPYARLWLPLHAAGWMMLGGLVVRMGQFARSDLGGLTPGTLRRSPMVARGAVAVVCIALALVHWGVDRPRPLPGFMLDMPTDNLRNAVSQVESSTTPFPVRGGPGLLVLGRRPLAYYLATRGQIPFRLLPGTDEFLSRTRPNGEWALVDEVQLGIGYLDGPRGAAVANQWNRVFTWEGPLDPVTLLDVNPEASYASYVFKTPRLFLFAPAHGASSVPLRRPLFRATDHEVGGVEKAR
ncbi:MAG: hypothetical protein NVSMB9_30010 [Isosphaeraceae bacterium]